VLIVVLGIVAVNLLRYDAQLNVFAGKDHHLQARPDYRHGWGAENAGNVVGKLGSCWGS
jgi:hypothetical protein